MTQRAKPLREALLLEIALPVILIVRGAVECRGPFDECRIRFDDRKDVDRRDVIADRIRRLTAKTIGIRSVDVGMGEEDLPYDAVGGRYPANSGDML